MGEGQPISGGRQAAKIALWLMVGSFVGIWPAHHMELLSEDSLHSVWAYLKVGCVLGSFASWLALTGLLLNSRNNRRGSLDDRSIWYAWAASGLFWTVFSVAFFIFLFP